MSHAGFSSAQPTSLFWAGCAHEGAVLTISVRPVDSSLTLTAPLPGCCMPTPHSPLARPPARPPARHPPTHPHPREFGKKHVWEATHAFRVAGNCCCCLAVVLPALRPSCHRGRRLLCVLSSTNCCMSLCHGVSSRETGFPLYLVPSLQFSICWCCSWLRIVRPVNATTPGRAVFEKQPNWATA